MTMVCMWGERQSFIKGAAMLIRFVFCVAIFVMSAATTFADTLSGTCKRADGSKVDGTATISTSWNSKKAFPQGGLYRLDFGGKVGKTITVYVDGQRYTVIKVDGDAILNIVIGK
jgi:hypothetical protein